MDTLLNEKFDELQKPQTMKERRAYYRYFYITKPEIASVIEENSFKIFNLGEIPISYSNIDHRSYINNFYKEMTRKLKLAEIANFISTEYYCYGGCTIFVENNDDSIKNKKRNIYDDNENYIGWKRVLILPPDYVNIRKLPLSENVELFYVSNTETISFLKKNKNLFKNDINNNNQIPLNQDPIKGSFAHYFSRKASQYDIVGTSVIEKYMDDLSKENKIKLEITKAENSLLNNKIKNFIEEKIFKPVALKKGLGSYPEVTIL